MSADDKPQGTGTPDAQGAGTDAGRGTAADTADEAAPAQSATSAESTEADLAKTTRTDTGDAEGTGTGVAEGTGTGVTESTDTRAGEGTGTGVADGTSAHVEDDASAHVKDDDASAGAEDDASAEPTARDAVSAPDAEGRPHRTTRRFPLFTRDTARPEGGGRAASRGAPAPARQWPILAVLSAIGLGLLLTALDAFRVGTILIGVALLAGAVLRWTLPDVGMLAVRSRFTDMVTYGVLGVAIVLLALMAQPQPLLEIPFLDDTLHFTVR